MTQAKVCAVLGVGPGLGSAVAERFAAGGYQVALMARREESMEPAREAIESRGGAAATIVTDAEDPTSVSGAFADVRDRLGAPDVLIYNAGLFQMGGILDIEPETFDRAWKANCAGAFYAAREVLPAMVERGGGSLFLTGATASWRAVRAFRRSPSANSAFARSPSRWPANSVPRACTWLTWWLMVRSIRRECARWSPAGNPKPSCPRWPSRNPTGSSTSRTLRPGP